MKSRRRLLIILTVGMFLILLSSSINRLIPDQWAVIIFVHNNPELADELRDLTNVMDAVKDSYVENKSYEELLNMAMRGIPSTLDPNNRLYIDKELEGLNPTLAEEKYFGIGAQLGEVGKYVVFNRIFRNSPAEKEGIKPGDVLLKINGENVWGMGAEKASGLIKGKDGTLVSLEIRRASSQKPETFIVERKEVANPSLEYEILENNIGYIGIEHFNKETSLRLADAINKLKYSDALIIDLRNNPGGLLDITQEMVGYFIGKGKTVIIQKERNRSSKLLTKTEQRTYPKKVVVLINNSSASASEIFAGNLRHYKVATLVGVRTYGKSTVQDLFYPSGKRRNLAMRLTIAHYLLPDGTNVSKNGVVPDIEVAQYSDFLPHEYKTARDLQFQKAIEILTTHK